MNPVPLPMLVPLVDRQGLITIEWQMFLNANVMLPLSQTARGLATVTVSSQTATIPATAVPLPTLAAGLYRLTDTVMVTTPASVSSSLAVTWAATTDGLPVTLTGAALTSNTAGATQSDAFIVRIDGGTALTYAVAYASVGTPCAYTLSITVERL